MHFTISLTELRLLESWLQLSPVIRLTLWDYGLLRHWCRFWERGRLLLSLSGWVVRQFRRRVFRDIRGWSL
jgi:hypothetical protein